MTTLIVVVCLLGLDALVLHVKLASLDRAVVKIATTWVAVEASRLRTRR